MQQNGAHTATDAPYTRFVFKAKLARLVKVVFLHDCLTILPTNNLMYLKLLDSVRACPSL